MSHELLDIVGRTWVECLNAQSPTAALTCSFGHNWVVLSFMVMDSILEVVVVATVVMLQANVEEQWMEARSRIIYVENRREKTRREE
jgi:hypothetical protein